MTIKVFEAYHAPTPHIWLGKQHSVRDKDPYMMFNFEQYFRLRLASIIGQIVVLTFAIMVLELHLPLTAVASIIALYALISISSYWLSRNKKLFAEPQLLLHLSIDVAVLDALLFFSGGATNPFVSLLLLPLVLAAITLSRRSAWLMGVLVIASYSVLMQFYVPIPTSHASHNSPFHLHILGMWFSFVFAALLVVFFIVKMSALLRERDREIAEARARALQNEHIIALGTFAAGAAHELGTPLATMAVLANEMQRECADAEQQKNAEILREQITRCKNILTQITAQSGNIRAESGRKQRVEQFLIQVINNWQHQRPNTRISVHKDAIAKDVYLLSDATLFQAFGNLLNNAADASPDEITLDAVWDDSQLLVNICDFGEGIDNIDMLDFSQPAHTNKPLGQGLGLFLANAVLKRFGGTLHMFNRPQGGACAKVVLPLNQFENENHGNE